MAPTDKQMTNGFSDQDRAFMKEALRLASRARGQTTPNPAVGAVIVRDGKIIGRGFHRHAGADHAEVAALKDANGPIKGATIYVTLEPCAHHGRTPPCADALIEAGLARVVVGVVDPNPEVGGQGLERMRCAGLAVECGLGRNRMIRLNEGFMHYHLTGRPLITCKWAMTLDGQTAAATGDSKWISNEESRKLVHQLRRDADAILAGIGTVLADNPTLNVRLPRYRGRQPIRLIADGGLRTPIHSNCVESKPGGETWFLATKVADPLAAERLETAGCRILTVEGRRQIIDFRDAIRTLAKEGVQSIFVEGGPMIHASLMREKLCDRAVAFIAPKTIGVPRHYRRSAIYGWGRSRMEEALPLHEVRVRSLGSDVCIEGDYTPWETRFGSLALRETQRPRPHS